MGDTSVDFFLENLKQLITSSKLNSIIDKKHQLQSLEEEIKYLREFLKVTEKKRNEHSEVMKLVMEIRDMVSEAENIVEQFVIDAFKADHLSLDFEWAKKEIRDVVSKAENIVVRFLIDAFKAGHLFLNLERVKKDIRDVVFEAEDVIVQFIIVIDSFKAGLLSLDLESLKKEIRHVVSKAENIVVQFVIDAFKAGHLSLDLERVKKFIRDAVSKAKNIVEQFVVNAFKAYRDYRLSLDLESVKNEIKTVTAKVKQIYDENICDLYGVAVKTFKHSSTRSGGLGSSGRNNTSKVVKEKVVVGFDDDLKTLLEKLDDRGEGRPLEIITIIGAGGGGKTTLAREVFDHPLTSHTFEIRAWVDVSQDYDKTTKKDLLIHILKSIFPEIHEDYEKSSEDRLGEKVLRFLKGRKYLIVMDDIWGIEAWNDIRRSCPKECKGSKVLFTSRQFFQPDSVPFVRHYLDPLPKHRSWELLQKKVFGMNCCPPELVDIGLKIAEKCEGLPLAIVTVAGILATEDKTLNMWEEVAKHLSSIIAKNKEAGCMEILELSYNHLPLHLKACFLYIGAFLEYSEIRVRELLWLWIAEGFIQQREEGKSLEAVARDHLICLIDRSLVMVARKSSLGGIKACRIHDLLRVFCLKKAKEDNFLVQIYEDDSSSPSATKKYRRLIVNRFFQQFYLGPRAQNLHSFLCLPLVNYRYSLFEQHMPFFAKNFERLRVLSCIFAQSEGQIQEVHPVHLRYIATGIFRSYGHWRLLEWIFNLLNLETLDLKVDQHWSCGYIELPWDIFKMVKLRHLYSKNGVFKYHLSSDEAARFGVDHSSKLDSLHTLHKICDCKDCRSFLVRTPNLRKLGLFHIFPDSPFWQRGLTSSFLDSPCLDLEFLKCLETLNLCSVNMAGMKLPPTVKRLTMNLALVKWEDLAILQNLPSLEVLKLIGDVWLGSIWNTSEEGFPQLKYLSLSDMIQIEEWNASEDQFPRLEVLVLKSCTRLERIPIDFATLNELREVKVIGCTRSVEESAREIQEEQRNRKGDDCPNLIVKPKSDDIWD